ncbi:signal transduction histidine-protein kinase/phosphatase UhpB [Photobacterium sp. SDRW27]|uniref:signal transduction histidine-protein kinase/phosphatase UhpB n=1 Tax=Photobacterium obscurum TaxID=2829490 RepID=UPI002243B5D3|nr:signal transduction histidine-protein kinase/phosphatase UhpB [Photobacterium obscurum]MCW8328871.1 signal transduction histidine-protein kinase/phosphatase UhpB [Photobacterium obscurum]
MKSKPHSAGHYFSFAFSIVIFSISWFCLWSISSYLSPDLLLAGLFLPTGLKLAVLVLTPRRFWKLFLVSELAICGWLLWLLNGEQHNMLLLLCPFVSYFLAIPFAGIWQRLAAYWQRLLAVIGLVLVHGAAVGAMILLLSKPLELPASYAFSGTITAITGGILLSPFFYLLYDYLNQKIWEPLSPTLIHQEITIRPSALLWTIAFFSIGLAAELTFIEQMEPLVLLIMLLPNIFMAYRYGWQGGVLAAVMNSILLTTARQISGSFSSDQELKIFITTQALVGLGLGIAISRQYLLAQRLQQVNQELAHELNNKQNLARQLVMVEEDIRKSVARELHDEIGQNITAIQIQAMLADRTTQEDNTKNIAETIHSLSMRIHGATRQLLTQLRPQILDELGLENALRQLAQEMKFAERQIDFQLNIGIANHKLDDITAVTLYRIVQELLNNVSKHSQATEVQLSLMPGTMFSLELRDNGCGLPDGWRTKGQGLKGIEERVSALGGNLSIQSDIRNGKGTRFIVNLPTKITTTEPI